MPLARCAVGIDGALSAGEFEAMKRLLLLLAMTAPSCTVMRSDTPEDGFWLGLAPRIALDHAESLIASGDARLAAEGYAIRSLLRVDASGRMFGVSEQMVRHLWIFALPLGIPGDVLNLPGQVLAHVSVSKEDRMRASRDIDLARALGVEARPDGKLELFGRVFTPIDLTSFYETREER